MILGNRCTRDCRFCGVAKLSDRTQKHVDAKEPVKIAKAVKKMAMSYVVITSPTRDDLPDGGASMFAETTKLLKSENPALKVELLIPDFKGSPESLETVAKSKPDVIGHNIETVKSLYPSVRPSSDYERSMDILGMIKKTGIPSKSGFMLGLGEKERDVLDLMLAIKEKGCDYLVIGQYLKPGRDAIEVKEFIRPEIFARYEKAGMDMGFKNIFAGTFCRSSYMAEKLCLLK